MSTFILVLILNIGTVERVMPNDLACNRAAAEAQISAPEYPGAVLLRASCRREA